MLSHPASFIQFQVSRSTVLTLAKALQLNRSPLRRISSQTSLTLPPWETRGRRHVDPVYPIVRICSISSTTSEARIESDGGSPPSAVLTEDAGMGHGLRLVMMADRIPRPDIRDSEEVARRQRQGCQIFDER